MAEPWLSVIMPTYNGAAYLPAALESIAVQGDPDIEVIAVDDGSTDASMPILISHRSRMPLQIVQREHNGNWVANTNHGLSMARGRWVSFLHQDDVWMPNRLAVLRLIAERRPDAALILHPSWFIDHQGRRLGLWRCPLRAGLHHPASVVERLLVQNFIALPAPVFQREAARKVGGLQEDLWYTADWDFWLKLAATGPTKYVPIPLAGFRIHPLSQTMRRSSQADELRRQLQVVLQRHIQPQEVSDDVHAVARFAADLNVSLATATHGSRSDWRRLFGDFVALGPAGWQRFFRDSRIAERIAARLRAGVRHIPVGTNGDG
jgi:GT2 family glycosyltransferase